MDQNIQKALWLGIGILFFVAVVSIGIFLFNKGQSIAETSGKQIDEANSMIAEAEFSDYSNQEVMGSDILNAINKYKNKGDEITIKVVTNYPTTYQYISAGTVNGTELQTTLTGKTKSVNDTDIKNANDKTSPYYINPYAKFYSQLIYDANGTIRGILATQQ